MRLESDGVGRFVEVARVNRSDGYEKTDGILVFFGDADLRAGGIDPDLTDFVGVRVADDGRVYLYEAAHADDRGPAFDGHE